MLSKSIYGFIALSVATLSYPSFASDYIGKVVLAQGNPLVERQDLHLPLKRNDKLFQKDRLITPVGSRLLIKLKDKTTISLAENTVFELSSYKFNKKKSEVSFKMLKGAFRTLTGVIGKQKDPTFEIHTPLATIGVRGTEFWGGMIFSQSLDVTMLHGKGVYVTNDYGTVEITQPGDGTMVNVNEAPSQITKWPREKLSKAVAATEVRGSRRDSEDSFADPMNESY